MDKIKKYKIYYKICLLLGVVGVLDIASHNFIYQNWGLSDMGFIGILILFILGFTFGAKIASPIAIIISMIVDLAIIWLPLAYWLNKKYKALESPTEENQKKLKNAKIIAQVVIGGTIIFTLLSVTFVIFKIVTGNNL